eukprot:COSAG01_NODE_52490_length_346_cov_0.927126_1_plen_84_part_01
MLDDSGRSINLALCKTSPGSNERCLSSPAQLRLPVTANVSAVAEGSIIHCVYWNISLDQWIVDSRGQLMDDGTVMCNTTHFTDF